MITNMTCNTNSFTYNALRIILVTKAQTLIARVISRPSTVTEGAVFQPYYFLYIKQLFT